MSKDLKSKSATIGIVNPSDSHNIRGTNHFEPSFLSGIYVCSKQFQQKPDLKFHQKAQNMNDIRLLPRPMPPRQPDSGPKQSPNPITDL